MRRLACAAMLLVLSASACSLNATGSRGAATATRTEPALSAEVAMPAGFPGDFPIYPHARLTAAATFASASQTVWGMEWESTDAEARVEAYYAKQLNLGDWVVDNTARPNGEYAATFSRKSDKNVRGKVAASSNASVTRILVSLVADAF